MEDVIADLLGRLAWEVNNAGLVDFNRKNDEAEKSVESLQSRLNSAIEVVGKFVSGIAAVGGKALDLTREFAEQGVEIDKWATKLGLGVEELQALELAGKSLNIEADNTREAFKTLQENLGELDRIGGGPAVEALGSLGIKLEEIKDLSAEEQFALIGQALTELDSDAKRTSVAIQLMGEDGAALLPLFKQGANGVRELVAAARESGQILGEDQVNAALDAKKGFSDLDSMIQRVANTFGAGLAPLIPEITSMIGELLEENEELISQDLPEFLAACTETLLPLVVQFFEGVAGVGDFADEVRSLWHDLDVLRVPLEMIGSALGIVFDQMVKLGDQLFGPVVRAIGFATDKLMGFVSGWEDANEQILKLKLLLGMDVGPETTVRGAPEFLGGDENPNNAAAKRRAEDSARVEKMSPREIREELANPTDPEYQRMLLQALPRAEAEAARVSEQGIAQVDAMVNAANEAREQSKAAKERARRRAKFERDAKAGSGGGGGSGGSSGSKTVFDKALDGVLLPETKPKKLTKAQTEELKKQQEIDRILTGSIAGASTGGGGASTMAGAKFVRVDASSTFHVTVTVTPPTTGDTPKDYGDAVAKAVEGQLAERWRQLEQHFDQVVKV